MLKYVQEIMNVQFASDSECIRYGPPLSWSSDVVSLIEKCVDYDLLCV